MGRHATTVSGRARVAVTLRLDPADLERIDRLAAARAQRGVKGATRHEWIRLAIERVLRAEDTGAS